MTFRFRDQTADDIGKTTVWVPRQTGVDCMENPHSGGQERNVETQDRRDPSEATKTCTGNEAVLSRG